MLSVRRKSKRKSRLTPGKNMATKEVSEKLLKSYGSKASRGNAGGAIVGSLGIAAGAFSKGLEDTWFPEI